MSATKWSFVPSYQVNVVCTVPGLWWLERVGRRTPLFYGAIWQVSRVSTSTAIPSSVGLTSHRRTGHMVVDLRVHRSGSTSYGVRVFGNRHDRSCLHVYCVLRKYVGTGSLGCYWRNLPPKDSSETSVARHRVQLVGQLSVSNRNARVSER